MTDSNGDLVEKVAQAIWKEESVAITSIPGPDYGPARAAIAAVLDDLMEPTQEMTRAGNMTGFKASVKTVSADVWQAMLTAKRKELGL